MRKIKRGLFLAVILSAFLVLMSQTAWAETKSVDPKQTLAFSARNEYTAEGRLTAVWAEWKNENGEYVYRYKWDSAKKLWYKMSADGATIGFQTSGFYTLAKDVNGKEMIWYISATSSGAGKALSGHFYDSSKKVYKYHVKNTETAAFTGCILNAPKEIYVGLEGSIKGKTGIQKINGRTYYLKSNGAPLINSSIVVDGYKYVFGETGKQKQKYKYYKPGWVKKAGNYYWRKDNGKYLQGRRWYTLNGKKYFLMKDGRRANGWVRISGKWYYFDSAGNQYKKSGWKTIGKDTYYLNTDYSRTTGLKQIKGKKYYFAASGKLVKNNTLLEVSGKYYSADKNGVLSSISTAKAKCTLETRSFIKKHTNSSMSNSQKFRACFDYLLAYMRYRPRPFNAADFVGEDWPYTRALSVYQSGLSGNCYGFACTVAACAKELGYEPYVIVTTGDHGFVMIDGKYYDNMGGLFGATTHFAYNVLHKVKF